MTSTNKQALEQADERDAEAVLRTREFIIKKLNKNGDLLDALTRTVFETTRTKIEHQMCIKISAKEVLGDLKVSVFLEVKRSEAADLGTTTH